MTQPEPLSPPEGTREVDISFELHVRTCILRQLEDHSLIPWLDGEGASLELRRILEGDIDHYPVRRLSLPLPGGSDPRDRDPLQCSLRSEPTRRLDQICEGLSLLQLIGGWPDHRSSH